MGLWRNDPETPEGKYPIVLRRDGTPLEAQYIVMTLRDPCAAAALEAYAEKLEELMLDAREGEYGWTRDGAKAFATDMRGLAIESENIAKVKPGDPGAPTHRKDDPVVLSWARSIGCPGS